MRVSWKGAGATLAAAALLVAGVDAVAYAATGDSLILGRVNTADRTTTVRTTAGGPALSLVSAGNRLPSLRVSSAAKVRSLNADLLDGRSASTLATRTVSFHGGHRGDVVSGGFAAWELAAEPGPYQVSFTVVAVPDPGQATEPVGVLCGVVDLNTLGPRTRVYTADSGTPTQELPVALSGADTVRIKAGQQPGLICATGTGSDFTLFEPVSASFTRVNARSLEFVEMTDPPMGAVPGLTR